MSRYPKAILFDLDDTLISFDGVSREAWDECCQDFVLRHRPAFSKEELLHAVQEAGRWYWSDPERHRVGRADLPAARREAAALALKPLGVTDLDLVHGLADRYTARHDELIHPYPNTVPTLDALKAAGVRLALITNGTSQSQRAKLTRFHLTGYFEHVLIEQETGFGKPDIRAFERALELVQLDAADCWMVGDNLVWDIAPPQRLGIRAVWHDWRGAGLKSGSEIVPDRIIREIGELVR